MDEWGGENYEMEREQEGEEEEPVVMLRPKIVRGNQNSPDTVDSSGNRRSAFFPNTVIPTQRIQHASPETRFEKKWPRFLIASFFLIGGGILIAYGIICIRYNVLLIGGNPPTDAVCSGASQDGGIAMLIVGLFMFPMSIWQAFVHRPERLMISN